MQLLHLWILSAPCVHSASSEILPEARQWKRIHTNSGSGRLTGSCRAALALGPGETNCWVPHGAKIIRAPTTNTFVETSRSCLVRGMKINELQNARANNNLLMAVQTVSKPYATGTCRVYRQFSCWWLKLMVGMCVYRWDEKPARTKNSK